MTTADNGLTYTFGTDSASNAIEPFGDLQLYRQTPDFPDFPMEMDVDYQWEGSRIRMPNYVSTTGMFPDGAPYFYGILPTVSIDGSHAPTLVPADKRTIVCMYANSRYCRAGGAFDPSPYEEQGIDGDTWPRGLSAWVMQLQLQVAKSGILAATRSTPVLGARLRRIANTRVWPYGGR